MKFIKWKSLIITSAVCLLPILFGVILWDKLPEEVAVHFNINNEPDNFASKSFAVFGLPLLMMLFQIICCVINDVNAKRFGDRKKFETVTKWIVPVMTIILQIVILGYAVNFNIDTRRVTALMVGGIFIVIGNFLPKFDYIKNYDIDTQKARKINRFIGFEAVIMGILMLITIFLPPLFTLIWLFLLIPYVIISIIYGIKVGRKK